LTMVLGLNESVSMQSMSVTIHALRSVSVTWDWLTSAFLRELATAALLGVSCGVVVCIIAWVWHHDLPAAVVIGGSVALSFVCACALGLAVPSLLHRLKLDPKIAAGPVTLASAEFHCARDLLHKRVAGSTMSGIQRNCSRFAVRSAGILAARMDSAAHR